MKLDLTQKVLTRPVVANFEKFLYAIKIYVWITSDWLKKTVILSWKPMLFPWSVMTSCLWGPQVPISKNWRKVLGILEYLEPCIPKKQFFYEPDEDTVFFSILHKTCQWHV